MSIKVESRQFMIDGKSTLLMSAELHYYRSDVSVWEKKIALVKEAGCNTIATYVPWVLHEYYENDFDFEGRNHERHNFLLFLELVRKADLYLIVRPGPFVMAEMLNDGIPRWLSEKYPETKPTTWDGRKATTVTLDYSNSDFLSATKKWYFEFLKIIEEYVYPHGNIIGIQLDNEVGMLSWVSNCPDLTETTLEQFKEYLIENDLQKNYNIDFNDSKSFREGIESPKDEYILNLQKDLGEFMRLRYKRYFSELRSFVEDYGIKDILYFINIHGTNGKADSYPIGVSQLYKSWQGNDFISASDVYLPNVDTPNVIQAYMANAITDSTNAANQPLSSLEFSAGDGNYGDTYSSMYNENRIDHMTRLFIAQGNKLLNYYTFSGGYNYKVNDDLGNGTNRIASTGEEHGYAAPTTPEGEKRWTYARTKRVINQMMNLYDKVSSAFEETSDLVYGFIPNYFMTEYFYRNSSENMKYIGAVTDVRAHHHWETFMKMVLLSGYTFKACNIQDNEIPEGKTIIIPSAIYMEKELQTKISDFILAGGNVLLIGNVPVYDNYGNECKILYKTLGIEKDELVIEKYPRKLSIKRNGIFGDYPEYFSNKVQLISTPNDADEHMSVCGKELGAGFARKIGNGSVVTITAPVGSKIEYTKSILNYFNLKPIAKLEPTSVDCAIIPTANENGEKFIHIFNLNDQTKIKDIIYKDVTLFSNYELLGSEAVMIPLDIKFKYANLLVANNELYSYNDNEIKFRLCTTSFYAKLKTDCIVTTDLDDVKITNENGYTIITREYRKYAEDYITITLSCKDE